MNVHMIWFSFVVVLGAVFAILTPLFVLYVSASIILSASTTWSLWQLLVLAVGVYVLGILNLRLFKRLWEIVGFMRERNHRRNHEAD